MQPALARQYLKAMGITAWEPRGAKPEAVPAPATPENQLPSAAGTSVSRYLSLLAEAGVAVSQPASGGQLLLVLEPPLLTSDATALLTNMLKAIDCDIAAQTIATFSTEAPESLSTTIQQVKPMVVIVMAMLNGDVAMLDGHRAVVHQPQWAGVPVAITMHPQELLVDPANKRPAWEDLKRVKSLLSG